MGDKMEKLLKKAAEKIKVKLRQGGWKDVVSIKMAVVAREGFDPSLVYTGQSNKDDKGFTISVEPESFQNRMGVWTELRIGSWGKTGSNTYAVSITELEGKIAKGG